jgi:hypothetical protein
VTGADQFRNQMNEIPGAPRRFASHGASDRFATTQGRALWVVLYRFPTAFQWVTMPLAEMGVPIGTARNSLKKFAKSGCQFREEEERAQSLAVVSNYSCARSNVLMAKRALKRVA